MISVCMTTFNGEAFLSEQIESILSQLSEEDELIISDDGSTDGTLHILKEFSDARIRLISADPKRLGPVYNLERALKAAHGEFLFLSDQDDIWLPTKRVEMLRALETSDLVLSDAFIYVQKANGKWEEGVRMFEVRPPRHGVFLNWLKNSFTGCCMAFRRELLFCALPFPERIPMHDQWIGICAEKKFRVSFLEKPLAEYRRHKKNATDFLAGKKSCKLQQVLWRFRLGVAILRRLSR